MLLTLRACWLAPQWPACRRKWIESIKGLFLPRLLFSNKKWEKRRGGSGSQGTRKKGVMCAKVVKESSCSCNVSGNCQQWGSHAKPSFRFLSSDRSRSAALSRIVSILQIQAVNIDNVSFYLAFPRAFRFCLNSCDWKTTRVRSKRFETKPMQRPLLVLVARSDKQELHCTTQRSLIMYT